MRSAVAALFLLPLRLVLYKKDPIPWRTPAFWLGGAAYSSTMILFVIANKLTFSANVILLQYSAPIWAALLAWLLIGEKPGARHWLGLGAVFLGLFIIFRDDLKSGNPLGDLLAVISGVTFGLNSVFLRMQKNAVPTDSMWLSHALTALAAVPVVFLFPPQLNGSSLFCWLFMGLIQSGLACQFFCFGIKRVRAVEAMLIAGIEPILNPLWVFLVTGEKPSSQALLGGAVIIGAVLMASIPGKVETKKI
jgi:drug/metabolite transporter (DMT)-like permease